MYFCASGMVRPGVTNVVASPVVSAKVKTVHMYCIVLLTDLLQFFIINI